MKPGTQSDLMRYLAAEYGIEVSRQAISLLVKAEDYRIKYTPEGKIIIDETAKLLSDSDFGKRSRVVRRIKEDREPAKQKVNGESEQSLKSQVDEDLEDYVSGKKKVTLASPPHIIRKYRDLQQAEKERIANEKSMKQLVNLNQTADTVFNFLRPHLDDLLEVPKRVAALANMAPSKREATKIISDEIKRILRSRFGGDFITDDQLKKKIFEILRR